MDGELTRPPPSFMTGCMTGFMTGFGVALTTTELYEVVLKLAGNAEKAELLLSAKTWVGAMVCAGMLVRCGAVGLGTGISNDARLWSDSAPPEIALSSGMVVDSGGWALTQPAVTGSSSTSEPVNVLSSAVGLVDWA